MPKELSFWIDEFIDFAIEGSITTLRLRAGSRTIVLRNEQVLGRQINAGIQAAIEEVDHERRETCILPMHVCPHSARKCESSH